MIYFKDLEVWELDELYERCIDFLEDIYNKFVFLKKMW